MRCFYHNSIDAVATCKNCCRGVCPECATEFPNGIACKDKCEAEVEALNLLIKRGKGEYQRTSSSYSRGAVLYLLTAVAFGIWGLIEVTTKPVLGASLMVGGVVFAIGAIFSYSLSKKYSGPGLDKPN